MMSSPKPSFNAAEQLLLQQFAVHLSRQTLGHALLFHGLTLEKSQSFLLQLGAMVLCHAERGEQKPCLQCRSCQLVMTKGHPDYTEIAPEKKNGTIKIEMIRDLDSFVYRSPQLGCHRVIVIQRAEKMNVAASNALLKLLEEPPNNVYFLLQATQFATMLPTVLSRCQLWRVGEVNLNEQPGLHGFLAMIPANDPDWSMVIEQLPTIIADIINALTEQKQHCASIAAKWQQYDLTVLVTILYWIHASFIKTMLAQEKCSDELIDLLSCLSVEKALRQMDKLNQMMRQLNQGIAINGLLFFEDFLLTY